MSTPVDTEARTVAALRVVANVRELELLAKLRAERAELERKRPVDVIIVRLHGPFEHSYIPRHKAPWFFLLLDHLDFWHLPGWDPGEDEPPLSRFGGFDLEYNRRNGRTAKTWAGVGSFGQPPDDQTPDECWAMHAMFGLDGDELDTVYQALGFEYAPLTETEKEEAETERLTSSQFVLRKRDALVTLAGLLATKLVELFHSETVGALALMTDEVAEAPSLRILATVTV